MIWEYNKIITQIGISQIAIQFDVLGNKKEKGAYYEAPKSLDMASPRGIEPLLPG